VSPALILGAVYTKRVPKVANSIFSSQCRETTGVGSGDESNPPAGGRTHPPRHMLHNKVGHRWEGGRARGRPAGHWSREPAGKRTGALGCDARWLGKNPKPQTESVGRGQGLRVGRAAACAVPGTERGSALAPRHWQQPAGRKRRGERNPIMNAERFGAGRRVGGGVMSCHAADMQRMKKSRAAAAAGGTGL